MTEQGQTWCDNEPNIGYSYKDMELCVAMLSCVMKETPHIKNCKFMNVSFCLRKNLGKTTKVIYAPKRIASKKTVETMCNFSFYIFFMVRSPLPS